MSLPRTLLCLALLVPYVGLAQESNEAPAPEPSESSEAQPLPPPPLLPAPAGPEAEPPEGELFAHEFEPAEQPGAPFTVGRGALEVLGGAVAGTGVGLAALLLTAAAIAPICDSDSCLLTIWLAGATGAMFAIPLGVSVAGGLMDGRGGYWPTLLGTMLGTGLGIAAAVAAENGTATAVSLTAGPLLGAVVAYELSHTYAQRSVSPTLGLSPAGGVVLGLSGRF